MPLPADSGLAASTVEAVARLITVIQAYAPSMNTLHFILDIEDRICSWLSLVDANVGLKLARILGTTCLDQDVSAFCNSHRCCRKFCKQKVIALKAAIVRRQSETRQGERHEGPL